MFTKERILILAKTYPSPSARYVETSCVAGITDLGQMRRLYPVPFRLMNGPQRFQKWQWITAQVDKTRTDHRVESHKIGIDTVECHETISPTKRWSMRWPWINKIPCFNGLASLEKARVDEHVTLALMRPHIMLSIEISSEREGWWTPEEEFKLNRGSTQGELFGSSQHMHKPLRKIPFAFHLRYHGLDIEGRPIELKHKIVDWEIGALYWNCRRDYGDNWGRYFRQKFEDDLFNKDLMLLLGTQHRFPNQWLIISLIYPPRAGGLFE